MVAAKKILKNGTLSCSTIIPNKPKESYKRFPVASLCIFGWLNLSYVYVYIWLAQFVLCVCVCVYLLQILSKTFLRIIFCGPNLLCLNFLSFDFISSFFYARTHFLQNYIPVIFFLQTLLTVLHIILGIKNPRFYFQGHLSWNFRISLLNIMLDETENYIKQNLNEYSCCRFTILVYIWTFLRKNLKSQVLKFKILKIIFLISLSLLKINLRMREEEFLNFSFYFLITQFRARNFYIVNLEHLISIFNVGIFYLRINPKKEG